MKNITISPKKTLGAIRPMNAVGGGPVTHHFEYDATKEFLEANIPFSRTHDIEYPFGSGEYVDIHCVFPDFEKDVNDPKSYNFALTDAYLSNILKAGAKPFYRLGSTIEHQPIKRYIFPPKDFKKWGEICSHIIDHYNNKWADGFEMGIEYWEIWNEPDLANRCWTGTDEDFFRLYEVASKILKSNHPELKIGGCAVTNPKSPFADAFLAYVKKTNAPLDFFSWHGYIPTPEDARELSEVASGLLDKYGFENVESIYDEWNYVVRWDNTVQRSIDLHKTAFSGAFVGGVMSALQKTRCDKSFYYDVQTGCMDDIWDGVFSAGLMEVHGEAKKVKCEPPFYAIKGWGDLRRLGTEVEVREDKDMYVTAATDGKKLGVLVSYYNDDAEFNAVSPADTDVQFDLGEAVYSSVKAFVTDSKGSNREIPFDGKTLPMEGNSFAYLEYEL